MSTNGSNPSRRARRQQLVTVRMERPRCPACDGWRLRKYRSIADQGDGSALWWVQCQNEQCHERFRVVLE